MLAEAKRRARGGVGGKWRSGTAVSGAPTDVLGSGLVPQPVLLCSFNTLHLNMACVCVYRGAVYQPISGVLGQIQR